MRCFECGLPDNYLGHGDGIGSCDCARCEWCGGPPGVCNCSEDDGQDWPDDVSCGPDCTCIAAPAAWPDRTHDGQRMRATETADVAGEVL
jgi:hypothetical protein